MTALRSSGGKSGALTRDNIREALREYAQLYGNDFAQAAFSPGSAKRLGRPDLVERYYAGRPDGRRWPSLNAIKSKYAGSWNAARADIGLPPNTSGPASGRRKAGEADAILTVRDRLVYVSNDEMDELRAKVMQLQNRLLEVRAARDRYRDELRNLPVGGDTALRERVGRYRRELDALRAERLAAPRVERVKVEKVREVKVRDSQVEDGLRAQLEDLRAKTVFLGDQKRAAEKEVARLHRELNLSASKAKAAVEGLGTATATAKALGSRIGALESRLGALQTERDEAYEQVALIYGEPRKLTSVELAGLRRTGPAGEALLARALKLLARARAERGDLNKALMAVAEAAINWRDRIR